MTRDICKFVSFSHGRVFDRSSGKDELGIRYLADNPRNEAEFVAEDCLRNKLISDALNSQDPTFQITFPS